MGRRSPSIIILVALFCLVPACAPDSTGPGAGNDDQCVTCFESYFWGRAGYGSGSVITTADGGYLLLGSVVQTGGSEARDLQLLKLSARGEQLWARTYGEVGEDLGHALLATGDGNYLLAGELGLDGGMESDGWLIKVDPAGEVIWSHRYGDGSVDRFFDLAATPGGGYILTGRVHYDTDLSDQLWLLHVDESGMEDWRRTWGSDGFDLGEDVAVTAAGELVVVGTRQYAAITREENYSSFWVFKTSALGDSIWSRDFGGAIMFRGHGVTVCGNGDILAVGEGAADESSEEPGARVIRLGDGGDVIWDRTFFGVSQAAGFSVRELADGDIVVAGMTSHGAAMRHQAYLLRLDSGGDEIWNRNMLAPNPDYLQARSVLELAGGDLLIAGTRTLFIRDDSEQIWVSRRDAAGLIP
jgi:hypothetical protein